METCDITAIWGMIPIKAAVPSGTRNAARGRSVTGALPVQGGIETGLRLEKLKKECMYARPDLDQIASDADKLRKKLPPLRTDKRRNPQTGEWEKCPVLPECRESYLFDPQTDTVTKMSVPVSDNENKISRRIFIRLGHDILEGYERIKGADILCGSPGEQAVIDAYGPALGIRLAQLGHTVKVYRSVRGTKKTARQANEDGVAEAVSFGAELFISCHANSFQDKNLSDKQNASIGGSMLLYNGFGYAHRLAAGIQSEISSALNRPGRALKKDNGGLDEIKDGETEKKKQGNLEMRETYRSQIPGIIIEPVFVTCTKDMEEFQKYQTQNAGGLGALIAEYIDRFLQAEG